VSTSNLDAADLSAALSGGLINEDVVQQIYNLDEGIKTPFTDLVGRDSFSSVYSEWTQNDLNTVDTANYVVDGTDASGNDTKIGTRVGNRAQISDKVVQISDVAEQISSVGNVASMAYQTAKRLMDLRRDVEAIAVGRQASVADDGSAVAGKTAGFSSWLTTNDSSGAGGSATGFNTSTKVVAAPVTGTTRALSWALVRDQIENVYTRGGDPSILMSVPGAIKRIGEFLMSSTGAPYRATPTANVAGEGSGAQQTAQGYIQIVVSDFGVALKLVPNRLQQQYTSECDVFLIDPKHVALAYLNGYEVLDLAKVGHSERKLVRVVWMTKVYREDAHAVVRDINPTASVTV
jgi:Family of unknown function (DUF5309)